MEEFVQTSREWMMENDITRLSMNDRKEADSYAENVVWWTNVFCLPLIAFVGLTCNTLNMLILTNNASTKRMPSSIVVAFNIERYICVCHPLYSHRLCTNRSSRLAIAICFAISLMCSLQWPICYSIKECWHSTLGHSFYIVQLNENPTIQIYYRFMDYFSLVGFNMLPVIALLLLNTKLVITLRKVIDEDVAR
uniref:G-protein coupled receptors family 1 profile domain-containing protein n=1 Tax=Parascaris equorum TaxID=6256 RepID=A0A914S3H9_PAREQ